MAYMDQEQKKELAPGIKAVLKKYGVKASIAVRHYSTLVVNIRSSEIDFGNSLAPTPARLRRPMQWTGHEQINTHWIENHWTGKAQEFLLELKAAMSIGNHDRSDLQSDYHDVGWYVEINVGRWNKPYELEVA